MILGGLLVWLPRIFCEHTVFALDACEIVFFALYWIVQNRENWDERVEPVQNNAGGG